MHNLLCRWDQFENEDRYEAAQHRGEVTYHPFLVALQERGDRSVFEAASQLVENGEKDKRLAGLAILRELGPPDGRPVFAETWDLLKDITTSETDVDVLRGVLLCLGRTHKPQALPILLRFASSQSPDLRFVVANNLLGCADQLDDPAILDVFLKLARDPDEEVRWAALWEINEYLSLDSDAVRSLLNDLQSDPASDVRELAQEAWRKSRSIPSRGEDNVG